MYLMLNALTNVTCKNQMRSLSEERLHRYTMFEEGKNNLYKIMCRSLSDYEELFAVNHRQCRAFRQFRKFHVKLSQM